MKKSPRQFCRDARESLDGRTSREKKVRVQGIRVRNFARTRLIMHATRSLAESQTLSQRAGK